MDYFINSTEHLLAELERIDLLIQVQVVRARQMHVNDEQFRGLYISEQELDALLKQPIGRPHWFQANSPIVQPEESLNQLKQHILLKKQATYTQGIELRLDTLQQLFQLDDFEYDVLLIVLAIELDLRYERLYAYLQDDVTKKKPSVDLVLNLLQTTPAEKLTGLTRFNQAAPLLFNDLVAFSSDSPASPDQPLLAKPLKLSTRIAQYLLGSDAVEERISTSVAMCTFEAQNCPDEYHLDQSLMHKFKHLLSTDWASRAAIINLIGTNDPGKQSIAETLCRGKGLNLLVVNLEQLLTDKAQLSATEFRLINREALLQKAAIYWQDFDTLFDHQQQALLNGFVQHVQHFPGLTFLASTTSWQPPSDLRATPYLKIELPQPTFVDRTHIWSAVLSDERSAQTDLDIAALAGKFKFTGAQIQDAAATAKNLAQWENIQTGRLSMKQLYEACRLHSNQKLSTLARKIKPKYEWNDIVLPPDRTEQLREICNHVKYRDRVYSDWGFDRKLAMGKGLCVLFAGPSGTGKTMAADILAGELGLDLYKIDLSTVVSKYIGETEKNLARIFTEAETSNAILFFDEADALFGKRSEVKDSHDRYANIETGYLLQRMEEHEGVVILASNFRKNMDEAFVRRLHFTVEFPFPSEEDRYRIWKNVWPDDTPRDPALDLQFFAGRFQMTGGNIRNIALSAAFLAADDSGMVTMQHLLRATQREYQKMGKVISEADFGLQLKDLVVIASN
jgi:AAA+ superfamily predicted ATPase